MDENARGGNTVNIPDWADVERVRLTPPGRPAWQVSGGEAPATPVARPISIAPAPATLVAPPVCREPLSPSMTSLLKGEAAARSLAAVIRRCASRWLGDVDRRASSSLVSLAVHLVLLIVLALLYPIVLGSQGGVQLTSLAGVDCELEELEELEVEVLDAEPDPPAANVNPALPATEAAEVVVGEPVSIEPSGNAGPVALDRDKLFEGDPEVKPGADDQRDEPIFRDLPDNRSANSPADVVRGLGGDMAKRFEEGDTLVVWMFDASNSMSGDRLAASKEMGRVFSELARLTKDRPYLHKQSLIWFGSGSTLWVPPTRKWSKLAKAVPEIPNDPTGVENVFAALEHAIPEYRKHWDKQLMFIIWTDESGNDVHRLESTVALCREHDVSVSVVGPTAVLGRRLGLQCFDINQRWSWWLPVDKGPDSGVPQLAQLPYWFGGPLPNAMPSGFGPYSLVRLSQATGGSFTVYDREKERGPFRDEDTLFARQERCYVEDLSKHCNHGLVEGGRWAVGRCGFGFSFDGKDDYIRVSDADSLDVSDTYTIALWVKPATGGPKQSTLVSKEGPGTDTSGVYNLYCGDSIRYEVNNQHPELQTEPGSIRAGAWHHVALVVDAAGKPNAALYVDGVLAAAKDLPPPAITSTDLCIGRRGFSDGHFLGVIDELVILDHALTQREVRALFQAGAKGLPLIPDATP